MLILRSVLGVFALTGVAWAFSEDRKRPPWRVAAAGLALQFALATLLLRVPGFRGALFALNRVMEALTSSLEAGTSFVFGYLGGGAPPFEVAEPARAYVFAFQGLPFILFISALSSVLFYWRILPAVVRAFSFVLERATRIGGAAGLSVAANVVMGMVEAPLLVAPYIKRMSRGELFIVMTSGMATVAGTVMVLYANILRDVIPNALGHVLTASLLNAPSAVVIASLMIPPGAARTEGKLTPAREAKSTIDAITHGTELGVKVLINVTAMLIVLVAMISLVNAVLGALPSLGGAPLTLQRVLGFLVAPIPWLMGIPWSEAVTAGGLLGVKTVLNEFIAYVDLANLPADALSLRSRLIMSYALCGFANLGSLGIMIGGVGAIVPERRDEITALGMRSILAGTLATCLTGAVAGIVAP